MRLVNITTKNVFSSLSGKLGPGAVSSDGGRARRALEEVLESIVKTCGSKLAIRLNERETFLLSRLMDLDDLGSKFNPSSIPEEIRNDPTGEARAIKSSTDAQQKAIEKSIEDNEKSVMREMLINGEIEERKPVGPATMDGEEVDPSDLKSGFERIMEENARIEAGKVSKKSDPNEMLDPIGSHMKTSKEDEPADETEGSSDAGPASPVESRGSKEDATRTADATVPKAEAQNPKNKMDAQAADIAGKLSVLGAVDNAPVYHGEGDRGDRPVSKPAARARGRGRHQSK